VKILLDTHILLWAISDSDKLSEEHRRIIENPDNVIFISIATLWELTIKQSLGKIDLPDSFLSDLTHNGYETMKIEVSHLIELKKLPLHHRDPFDRILIAQAISENCKLLTTDHEILKYNGNFLN